MIERRPAGASTEATGRDPGLAPSHGAPGARPRPAPSPFRFLPDARPIVWTLDAGATSLAAPASFSMCLPVGRLAPMTEIRAAWLPWELGTS